MIDQASYKGHQTMAVLQVNFVIVYFILNFVASALLDIINTVYICYSMDRDQRWECVGTGNGDPQPWSCRGRLLS